MPGRFLSMAPVVVLFCPGNAKAPDTAQHFDYDIDPRNADAGPSGFAAMDIAAF